MEYYWNISGIIFQYNNTKLTGIPEIFQYYSTGFPVEVTSTSAVLIIDFCLDELHVG